VLVVPKLERYGISEHVLWATPKVGAGLLDRVTGIAHKPEQSMFKMHAMNGQWSEMAYMRIRPVCHHSILSYNSGVIHCPI
jgi:hypothetical protein